MTDENENVEIGERQTLQTHQRRHAAMNDDDDFDLPSTNCLNHAAVIGRLASVLWRLLNARPGAAGWYGPEAAPSWTG